MVPAKGYAADNTDIVESIRKLENYIEEIPIKIQSISSEELSVKLSIDKWSKKEIAGHLVDSAINNLKRFTEIQFGPHPYIITAYNQVELVKVNNYQTQQLDQIMDLWQALNRQIVFVVSNIPAEKLSFKVDPQYESRELKTLEWIIIDYVAHMEHHFNQIFNH